MMSARVEGVDAASVPRTVDARTLGTRRSDTDRPQAQLLHSLHSSRRVDDTKQPARACVCHRLRQR